MANHPVNNAAGNPDVSDPVIAACEHEWDSWKSDCSGFVRAVAKDLGVALHGLANTLVESMSSSPEWIKLDHSASQAISYANQGYLVIAGLAEPGHGHVAVIVRASSSTPMAYWGRLGGVGHKYTSIHLAWTAAKRPHVWYFARTLPIVNSQ